MKSKIRRGIHTACLVVLAVCAVIATAKICMLDVSTAPTVEEQSSVGQPFDAENHMSFATPYGELYFPSEYQAYLKTARSDENGVYKLSFSYDNGQGSWELYTVCFGDESFGQSFGTVGSTPFTIRFGNGDDAAWTEEDTVRVSAMREAVNVVIRSVEFFDDFQRI